MAGFLEEALKRAHFAARAARRVGKGVLGGKPISDALQSERRNFQAHVRAQEQRRASDDVSTAAAARYGRTLGWYLGPNENHCRVCLAAEGHNYDALRPPAIGVPGTPHPNCTCSPGAPFPDGKLLR